MAEKTGNMFYRGDWKVCCEYNVGDVVQRAGALYMAMEQSAGMDPLDPLNAKYWKLTFAPIVPPTTKHNELEGLQGGDAAKDEFYHLTKDQAEAAVHAKNPSKDNPFLTAGELPYLARRVTDFELIKKPSGIGQLYGVTFGEGRFVAVGDDCGVISPDGTLWFEQPVLKGFWRGVAYGGGVFAAVGLGGKAMYSADGGKSWRESVAPEADWNAVAHGNGVFVAVADGKIMRSLDGKTQWTEKAVPGGYGTDVAFGDGLFLAVGPKGALTSPDGENWTERDTPRATWRAVGHDGERFLILGGKGATTKDGTVFDLHTLPAGGWDAVVHGGGFWVAVGGAYSCMVSPSGILDWKLRDVPNFVFSDLAFGKDTFVAVGSGIMIARIVDVAAALDGANAPSGTNVFVTMEDLKEVRAAIRVLFAILTWNTDPGELTSWADVLGISKDLLSELLNDILRWKEIG